MTDEVLLLDDDPTMLSILEGILAGAGYTCLPPTDPRSPVDASRLGARDFLIKPIRPPELIEAVGRVMNQARHDRSAHSARPPEVEQLIRQAEELAGRLRRLAYASDPPAAASAESANANERSPARASRTAGEATKEPAGAATRAPTLRDRIPLFVLETIEQMRGLRNRYEHRKLDDIAWDLLLELLRAERLHALAGDGVSSRS